MGASLPVDLLESTLENLAVAEDLLGLRLLASGPLSVGLAGVDQEGDIEGLVFLFKVTS